MGVPMLPRRLLAIMGVAVLSAGCVTTHRHTVGTTTVPTLPPTTAPTTTTTTTTTTTLPPTTTTTVYIPPPTTTSTAAAVTCSISELEAEMDPEFQQTIGRYATPQEAEQFGQQYYGCTQFTP
jgi:hypothetical protein